MFFSGNYILSFNILATIDKPSASGYIEFGLSNSLLPNKNLSYISSGYFENNSVAQLRMIKNIKLDTGQLLYAVYRTERPGKISLKAGSFVSLTLLRVVSISEMKPVIQQKPASQVKNGNVEINTQNLNKTLKTRGNRTRRSISNTTDGSLGNYNVTVYKIKIYVLNF